MSQNENWTHPSLPTHFSTLVAEFPKALLGDRVQFPSSLWIQTEFVFGMRRVSQIMSNLGCYLEWDTEGSKLPWSCRFPWNKKPFHWKEKWQKAGLSCFPRDHSEKRLPPTHKLQASDKKQLARLPLKGQGKATTIQYSFGPYRFSQQATWLGWAALHRLWASRQVASGSHIPACLPACPEVRLCCKPIENIMKADFQTFLGQDLY